MKEIKHSTKCGIIKILGNLAIVILAFYLISLLEIKKFQLFELEDYFIIMISIIFIVYYGKKGFVNLSRIGTKIIFSEDGIKYKNKLFDWKKIEGEKVISKKGYTPKYRFEYTEYFLVFKYKNEKININIEDYLTSPNEIEKLLKEYRGNNNYSKFSN